MQNYFVDSCYAAMNDLTLLDVDVFVDVDVGGAVNVGVDVNVKVDDGFGDGLCLP